MQRLGFVDPSMNICHKGRKMDALFAMYLKVIRMYEAQFVHVIVNGSFIT